MKGIYLLLGSNLGRREEMLGRAIASVESQIGMVLNRSSMYRTKAWGLHDQPDFLNMVLQVRSGLAPIEILNQIGVIENLLGRERYEKWGTRSIDIDILYYGDLVLQTPRLTIPHPRIEERRFTLVPMCELVPGLVHPVSLMSQTAMLDACQDDLEVQRCDLRI